MKKMPNKSRQRGLSMVELVITAGLVVILSTLVVAMISRSFKSYRISQEIIDLQDEAAKAMRDFEKVARAAEEVLIAGDNEFAFYAYLAGDDHPAPSKMRYYFEGGNIKRGRIMPEGEGPTYEYPPENEVVDLVIDYIINGDAVFTYFSDEDYDYNDHNLTLLEQPVSLTTVRMVKIIVIVDKDQSKIPEAIEETTGVSLRNLKDNL